MPGTSDAPPTSTLKPRPIPDALEHLRAEAETAWLPEVFVPPTGFQALLGDRSMAVFGSIGSGKTALRIAAAYQMGQSVHPPLVVAWYPSIRELAGAAGRATVQVVEEALHALLQTTAQEILAQIAQTPHRYTEAPSWQQELLAEFVHTFVRRLPRQVARLMDNASSAGQAALAQIRDTTIPTEGIALEPQEWLQEVGDLIERMGWRSLWIAVDGLESWLGVDREQAGAALSVLMSTLELFELAWVCFKIFVPQVLRPQLAHTGAVLRRRLEPFDIVWGEDELRLLVQRRLAAMLGQEELAPTDLCRDSGWLDWLAEWGGETPRGWLETVRPLALRRQELGRPLTVQEWRELRRSSPPPLRIDLEREQVYLGHRPVTGLTPQAYRILRYLYLHPRRRCSREEIFREVIAADAGQDAAFASVEWRSAVDTAIYRLRQDLEPEPKRPVYVVTERGKGITLRYAW